MHEQITALLNSGGFLAFSIPKVEQSSTEAAAVRQAKQSVTISMGGSVINSLRKINPVLCGKLHFYIPQNYFTVQVNLAKKDDCIEVGIMNRHCYLASGFTGTQADRMMG